MFIGLSLILSLENDLKISGSFLIFIRGKRKNTKNTKTTKRKQTIYKL